MAVMAFEREIARARLAVHEPMLAAIRLQWWKDKVEQGLLPGTGLPPAAEILGAALACHRIAGAPSLLALIEAHEEDLDGVTATPAAFEARMVRQAAPVATLLLGMLEAGGEPETLAAARSVVTAWNILRQLRLAAIEGPANRSLLPQAPPALLAELAASHLEQARARRAGVASAALPLLLQAVLAEDYLRRFERAGYVLQDPLWGRPNPNVARLVWRRLIRRY